MNSTTLLYPALPDIGGILAPRRGPPPSSTGPYSVSGKQPDEKLGSRILIVEDDWFVAMDIQGALKEAGYEVLDPVVSADSAVEAAGAANPDLVIMDIRLVGERDGIDAAIEIRRRFDIPCLFVSAYGNGGLAARAKPARPAGWLTKPISGHVLVAAVKELLGRK